MKTLYISLQVHTSSSSIFNLSACQLIEGARVVYRGAVLTSLRAFAISLTFAKAVAASLYL